MRIPSNQLVAAISTLFAQAGSEQAQLVARALVEADLAEHKQFGTELLTDSSALRLPLKPPLTTVNGPLAEVEARDGFGPLLAAQGAVTAHRLAQTEGVGVVRLPDVGRLGRLAPYVAWLAERKMTAFFVCTSFPLVAPAGGRVPVLGTNPLAAALPLAGGDPLVIDTATSAITYAAVKEAQENSAPLPSNVALDRDGKPTTDPATVASLLPRNGTFGSVIGLLVEMLTVGIVGTGSKPSQTRSAVLMAFKSPALAPQTGSELAARWVESGGHLPGGSRPKDVSTSNELVEISPKLLTLLREHTNIILPSEP